MNNPESLVSPDASKWPGKAHPGQGAHGRAFEYDTIKHVDEYGEAS
ncbi:MAG TPA: hypothetical protein VLF40_01630 [Candidatus Saccharimonadales bacterium]|nr:hypothetical protein [Candidatus Saccharimonadales bacterium]